MKRIAAFTIAEINVFGGGYRHQRMKALQRMVRFMDAYWGVVIIGLVTVILPVAMELVIPRMLQYVIDYGIKASNMDVIIRGSLIMLGAALVGAVATVIQGLYRARLSQGIAYDLRNALFRHIQSFSFGNLDTMQTGQLITRLSSDVDVVRLFLSAGLSLLLRAVLMIVGSVVMIVLTDLQLSLVVLVVLAVAGAVIWTVLRTAAPLFTVVQQKLAGLNTIVQENLAGVQVVKAFVREKFEIARFGKHNLDYTEQNIKVGYLVAVAMPVLLVLTNLGSVAVIWFGGLDVIGGRLSVGQLVAFNNYLVIGMTPLLLLGNVLTMVSRAEASAARILEVLDTRALIQPVPSPHRAERVAGRVAFENVSFHYNGIRRNGSHSNPISISLDSRDGHHQNGRQNKNGSEEVLNNVSFEVEPGQRVALLGATGSGKSTLVNLIPRFYDVTGGRIWIDGVDVRDWDPEALRSQIGVVLQQTILFSGTIRQNIAYGRPDAPLDKVIAVAQAAQAHEFIMAMPEGYESMVEERGANLSGGQRQRIAIARALLISPGVLILDDSTSAVDMETEVKIQQALHTLMKDRTTFIVAQRINSVLDADQILVLDGGQIAAQGTHRQLLQTSPIYQEIYHSQLGGQNQIGASL
jgi:ATP-binding cassette subfamily B multidrug efflux pump